jgi:hypothetical protein
VHDDGASAEELAALQAAVLRSHDQFVRMEPTPRSLRVARRLKRLHLSWLAVPWALVDIARLFMPAFRGRGFPADEEQAVRLYRRLSGKDPHVARAEIWRIGIQLGELDERLRSLWGRCLATTWPGGGPTTSCWPRWRSPGASPRRSPSSWSSVPGIGSALAAAVPTRWSRSMYRRRPTATARLGGAGLTSTPGRTRRAGRGVRADVGSWLRERHPGAWPGPGDAGVLHKGLRLMADGA